MERPKGNFVQKNQKKRGFSMACFISYATKSVMPFLKHVHKDRIQPPEPTTSGITPSPSASGKAPASVTNLRSRGLLVVADAINQLPTKWANGDIRATTFRGAANGRGSSAPRLRRWCLQIKTAASAIRRGRRKRPRWLCLGDERKLLRCIQNLECRKPALNSRRRPE